MGPPPVPKGCTEHETRGRLNCCGAYRRNFWGRAAGSLDVFLPDGSRWCKHLRRRQVGHEPAPLPHPRRDAGDPRGTNKNIGSPPFAPPLSAFVRRHRNDSKADFRDRPVRPLRHLSAHDPARLGTEPQTVRASKHEGARWTAEACPMPSLCLLDYRSRAISAAQTSMLARRSAPSRRAPQRSATGSPSIRGAPMPACLGRCGRLRHSRRLR